ncbi:MAG: hypothetical protein Q9M09_05090 [Mariprofundaceae bacterium]|nr:hypothetical protein [Mariprofundaceae bacterium]
MRKSWWVICLLLSGLLALNACKKDGDAEKTPEDKTVTSDAVNKDAAKIAIPVALPVTIPSAASTTTTIPAAESTPLGDISGHYSASSGHLDVMQISGQLSRFSIQMEGGTGCSAQISGMLSAQDNSHGVYEEQGCMLKFAFDQGIIQVTEEGENCNTYHDNSCSFSDIYRLNSALNPAPMPTMPTGHYMHKHVSVDGVQCHGWEVWLTAPASALDVKVALYQGRCVASTVSGTNVLYDPRSSALSFDMSTATGAHSFSGTFNEASDLQGHVTP